MQEVSQHSAGTFECPLLFVYGSLRRHCGTSIHSGLGKDADFIALAATQGKLYQVAGYPGLVESAECADLVHGELYRMHHPQELLEELDEYEECTTHMPTPHEFIRQIIKVKCPDGFIHDAWAYIFNYPVTSLPCISSGDYLHYLQTKQAL